MAEGRDEETEDRRKQGKGKVGGRKGKIGKGWKEREGGRREGGRKGLRVS